MAVPSSKAELLHAVIDGYDKLSRDLARVPGERAREKAIHGHVAGAMISPADLVAYLIGWNELVLSWHEQRHAGVEPEFPAAGYRWNQLGELAQKFYDDYSGLDWSALLVRFANARRRIVALIDAHSDHDLYGVTWYGKYTAGRMIQFNTSSPYANARRRLRAWLRNNNL